MWQAAVKKGKVVLVEVPEPTVSAGRILIKVMYSCISTGTEIAKVSSSGESAIRKALRQPEKIKKVFESITAVGLDKTLNLVQSKLGGYAPAGYSVSGMVVGIGEGVRDFKIGNRVAAGGAGFANHAEFVEVPRNLAVKLPDGVDFKQGSTTTIGSIALQGLRRMDLRLGEYVVVFGLGVIGQLSVQMAKASGCIVIGVDLDEARLLLAKEHGADYIVSGQDDQLVDKIVSICGGHGADAVVFTAATSRNEPLSQAFKITRKKGKVVLVGAAGPEIRREDIYEKEIDFLISCSYGPGRYDENYELKGNDYPYGYVRWTENRNMQAYLRLLRDKLVRLDNIIETIYPIKHVERAYELLKSDQRPLTVLLEYNQDIPQDIFPLHRRTVINPSIKKLNKNIINVGLIGVGKFATGVHLPNLKQLSNYYQLYALADKSSLNVTFVAERYGAKYCTSDYQQIMKDPEVDLVMICTRHNLHGSMVLEALKLGKHVFVEKPLALTRDELNQIEAFYSSAKARAALPVLMTGFNRRFSPYVQRIREFLQGRTSPMIINYRMNAGYIPLDHWVHTEEGGGRNLGEACHIYDLFTYLTDSAAVSVDAQSIKPGTDYYSHRDNFVAMVTFADGSVATLTYTSLGCNRYPKEQVEIFVDGSVLVLNDYKELAVAGGQRQGLKSKIANKGHKEELQNLAKAIRQGGDWPNPLWQQLQAMEIAFAVDKMLAGKV